MIEHLPISENDPACVRTMKINEIIDEVNFQGQKIDVLVTYGNSINLNKHIDRIMAAKRSQPPPKDDPQDEELVKCYSCEDYVPGASTVIVLVEDEPVRICHDCNGAYHAHAFEEEL